MHLKLTDTLSKYRHVVLVGGGTGGHIQPILNIASELHGTKLLWIGGEDSYEKQAAKDVKIDFESIPTLKLTSTKSPKVLLYPIVLMRGILAARQVLKKAYADIQGNGYIAVFSKGGPGSVAVGIAAWSLGIPLYIHESDTIPGRSNRILGHFATRVFLGFQSARKYFNPEKCEVIGQILHPIFSTPAHELTSSPAIHWNTDKKHLLVICGSQGARVIFEEILRHITTIVEKYEVILVLGKLNTDMRADFEKALKDRKNANLTLLDWIDQESLASLIRDTDIAITRGSATTLAELTGFQPRANEPTSQPANQPHLIIIPLPYAADNHQYYNALEYQKIGHTLLEQKNISTLIDLL